MAITNNVSRKSALTNLGTPAELSELVSKLQNPGVSTPQPDHRLYCKAVNGEILVSVVKLNTLIQHPLLLPKAVRAFRQLDVQMVDDCELQFVDTRVRSVIKFPISS